MSEATPRMSEPFDIDLPGGWATATIGEVTVPKVDQAGPGKRDEFTYIDLAAVSNDNKSITAPRVLSTADAPSRAKQVVESGDVLVSLTRPNLNGVALVGPDLDGAIASTGFDVLRAAGVAPGWLFLVVCSQPFIDSMTALVQGALYPAVRPRDVRGFRLLLPPRAEQERVVAKVEALLECVNEAGARLANVPAIIKRFRQSVLAAACSGQLTAEWREGNDLEAADQLLARLRSAGSTKADLAAEFPVKRWRVIDVRQPQLDKLPSIPEPWAWVYLPDLGYMNRGRSRNRPRNAPNLYGGLYPFLQTGDVAQSGGRIVKHRQTYNEAGLAQSRLWPAGTICITIAANIADSAILTYPACFPDSVVGLITDSELCVAEFAEFFIRTAREDLSQFAPATAQKNINIGILNEVAVPLPPLAEQREIVRRVGALFALADGIEGHVRAATGRAERLPDAILARAFRGELVATEAELAAEEGRDYEHADQLLVRIREEASRQNYAPKAPPTATERTAAMKRMDASGVLNVIEALPQDSFTFDDLRAKLPGDYDTLKDIIFALLDDPQSGLVQEFDRQAKGMRFRRAATP